MTDLPQKFRFGFQLVYLAICVVFVGTVAIAATWGAFGGNPATVDEAEGGKSDKVSSPYAETCSLALGALHDEMAARAL